VVVEGGIALQEGAIVTVVWAEPEPHDSCGGVQFPLVPNDRPGSLPLANERIAELLEDDDVLYARHGAAD
jgi:hypothetical protein